MRDGRHVAVPMQDTDRPAYWVPLCGVCGGSVRDRELHLRWWEQVLRWIPRPFGASDGR